MPRGHVNTGLAGLRESPGVAAPPRRQSFESQALPVEEGPDQGDPDTQGPLGGQKLGDLSQREGLGATGFHQPEDEAFEDVEKGVERLTQQKGDSLTAPKA